MLLRSLVLAFLIAPVAVFGQLEGVIDLHVHSAPDSGPRSITAIEVARIAVRHDMGALLFKNHYTQTASLAYLVSQVVPGIEVYGGIALNRSVGGINPTAVEHMARMTGGLGRVVWMPTFDSEHYHRVFETNPGYVSVARDGKLLPDVLTVLDIMAANDLSLATGHSSPAESILLIEAAKARGIDRILVTHPAPKPVAMDVETQKKAASMGALLEYPFNATLPPNPVWPGGYVAMPDYIAAIRAVGPENVVISSDLGQQGNPIHADGLIAFITALSEAGFTETEIEMMTKRNPARFLGVE